MWYLIKVALAVCLGLIPFTAVVYEWVINRQLAIVPAITALVSLLMLAALLMVDHRMKVNQDGRLKQYERIIGNGASSLCQRSSAVQDVIREATGKDPCEEEMNGRGDTLLLEIEKLNINTNTLAVGDLDGLFNVKKLQLSLSVPPEPGVLRNMQNLEVMGITVEGGGRMHTNQLLIHTPKLKELLVFALGDSVTFSIDTFAVAQQVQSLKIVNGVIGSGRVFTPLTELRVLWLTWSPPPSHPLPNDNFEYMPNLQTVSMVNYPYPVAPLLASSSRQALIQHEEHVGLPIYNLIFIGSAEEADLTRKERQV